MTSTPDAARWHPPPDRTPTLWVSWANELPMVRDLGLECTEVGDARAVFVLPRSPLVPNPNGAVNGGVVVLAADLVMGVLGARVARPGELPATGTLTAQFHSPSHAPLTLCGSVIGGGRRVTFVEVVVTDRDGRRCVSCQGTMIAGGTARRT